MTTPEWPHWRAHAACRGMDPNIFFPERGGGRNTNDMADQAKQVCGTCPVTDPCLTFAINNRESLGIWGGMNERHRRQEVRDRLADGMPRQPNRVDSPRTDEIMGLLSEGRTKFEVAKALGLNSGTVANLVNRRQQRSA